MAKALVGKIGSNFGIAMIGFCARFAMGGSGGGIAIGSVAKVALKDFLRS